MIQQATASSIAAERNYQRNLQALQQSQPELANTVSSDLPDADWLLGRDGCLTARLAGQWWSDCSLPLRAAQALLEKLELGATVSCFLSPTHAAQVRVTLDRLSAGQALIAVVPQISDFRLMIACDDFAGEIRAGRLWFVTGEQWDTELEQLLITRDGLPTPGQFARTTLVEGDQINAMIRRAQRVFSREINRRADPVRSLLRESTSRQAGQVCVIAPSAFRLWEDGGGVLRTIAKEQQWRAMDPDDPRQASPVAVARAAADCEVVVVIDRGRADLPSDLSVETRVITWLTGWAIPRFVAEGTRDRLLVIDPQRRSAVIAAGWPADHVILAGWPAGWHGQAYSLARGVFPAHGSPGNGAPLPMPLERRSLAIIADTLVIASPTFELSSQNILWESIHREIADDPFALGADLAGYLNHWLARVGIAEETVDRAAFVQRLILPAYQQGLARWLIGAKVALRLFGRGWDAIEEFAPHHVGEITDRAALCQAIEASAAVVHVWPGNGAHPVDTVARPILRRASKTKELWLAEAKRLTRSESRSPTASNTPPLSADLIRRAAGVTQPA
jgi:hypothetical protein